MACKTPILDLDGTIADTQKSIIRSMRFVVDSLGIKDIDESLVASQIGMQVESKFRDDKKALEFYTRIDHITDHLSARPILIAVDDQKF